MCSADIFLAFLAILFPPLPVWVKSGGICTADSFINILLCILGFIPGLIHSWYIIARYPEPPYEYESLPQDREGGRVTYVYVQTPPCNHQPQKKSQTPPQNNNLNYGTRNAGPSQPAVQPQQHGVVNAGEGSSNEHGVPPSYAEVVAGDHKIQSRD